MLPTLLVLIAFQICGEAVAAQFRLPISGPVIGMALLVAALMLRGAAPTFLEEGARGLLRYLPLLFVPAGVGIIAHLPLIGVDWLPISLALIGSSALTLIVSAMTMLAVERCRELFRSGTVDLAVQRSREGEQ